MADEREGLKHGPRLEFWHIIVYNTTHPILAQLRFHIVHKIRLKFMTYFDYLAGWPTQNILRLKCAGRVLLMNCDNGT